MRCKTAAPMSPVGVQMLAQVCSRCDSGEAACRVFVGNVQAQACIVSLETVDGAAWAGDASENLPHGLAPADAGRGLFIPCRGATVCTRATTNSSSSLVEVSWQKCLLLVAALVRLSISLLHSTSLLYFAASVLYVQHSSALPFASSLCHSLGCCLWNRLLLEAERHEVWGLVGRIGDGKLAAASFRCWRHGAALAQKKRWQAEEAAVRIL